GAARAFLLLFAWLNGLTFRRGSDYHGPATFAFGREYPYMANLLKSILSPADLKKLPLDQLPHLAQEMRELIMNTVGANGGHLAPNLGTVEICIALHLVFNFPQDRLLWDVGHQCYPHKLL